MIEPGKFYDILKDNGVDFFTGVPDSLLNDFCLYLSDNLNNDSHVISANEGNAIAIAAGYHLTSGGISLVYMQNSGLGNSLNPLISLTNKETYAIPMILLIGWRGEPGINDWAHHNKQGKETPVILDLLDIPYKILEDDESFAREAVNWAFELAKKISGPVALLVKKGVLAGKSKKDLLMEESTYSLTRENAISCLVKALPEDTIFVATTGRATREICAVRTQNNQEHNNDFLNVGAMGHASSIALGMATGNPQRTVVCLDGDCSAIMHLGSFAICGTSGRSNLLHIILNNGVHESVGGQPGAGHTINFTKIAKNSGYNTLDSEISDEESIRQAIKKLSNRESPGFIDIRIRKGIRKGIPDLKLSLVDRKEKFMEKIAGILHL